MVMKIVMSYRLRAELKDVLRITNFVRDGMVWGHLFLMLSGVANSGLLYCRILWSFPIPVILGLDPRIHRETSKVPVARWIPGSNPGMTKKEKGDDEKKHRHSECSEESRSKNKANLFELDPSLRSG